jgi:hypothetical protein
MWFLLLGLGQMEGCLSIFGSMLVGSWLTSVGDMDERRLRCGAVMPNSR